MLRNKEQEEDTIYDKGSHGGENGTREEHEDKNLMHEGLKDLHAMYE